MRRKLAQGLVEIDKIILAPSRLQITRVVELGVNIVRAIGSNTFLKWFDGGTMWHLSSIVTQVNLSSICLRP